MKHFSKLKEYVENGNGYELSKKWSESDGVVNYAHFSGILMAIFDDLLEILPIGKWDVLRMIDLAEIIKDGKSCPKCAERLIRLTNG